METVITKSYQGAQTRLLLPKVKDVAGVIGDNNSTRICFKLPRCYVGWAKYIEFDCEVEREGEFVHPAYLLDENDSFTIPIEITEAAKGKEVAYNLKLVSQDGTVTEKSELSILYFRNSSNGVHTEPEPYTDIISLLYNNAYCSVEYTDPVDGAQEPQLIFSPLNPTGAQDSVALNVPYLDENGHIPSNFIDKEIVVEIFKIASPDELTTLTSAQPPDMALISDIEEEQQEAMSLRSQPMRNYPPYYMDLYMLVGDDPTVLSNWYLVHTSNPNYTSVQTENLTAINGDISYLSSESITAESISATTIEGTFSGDLTGDVTGNLSGNASTATVLQTPRSINGTNFDGSSNITTAKWGTARDITIKDNDNTHSATVTGIDGSANINLKLPGTIKAELEGNATSATTANNYNTSQGTIKTALDGKVDKLSSDPSGADFVKVNVNSQGQVTGHSSMVESDIPTLSISKISNLQSTLEGKAPVSHASSESTYGLGTASLYGHVKFKSDINADARDVAVSENGIKNFVNSSINAVAAYYITYNLQGDRFPSAQALKTATTLYSGGEVRVPTRNDYAVVIADETHMEYTIYYPYFSFTTTVQYVGHYVDYNNNKTLVTQENRDNLGIVPGTTVAYEGIASDARYIYAGTGDTYDGSRWEYNFPLGRTFTNAEQLAIDSGITAEKVNKLDGIAVGAQVNVLESVKINDSPLSISNKAVNINITNSNPTFTWGASATLGSIGGQSLTVNMPTTSAGSDLKPVKIVSGVPTPVANDLVTTGNIDQDIDGTKSFLKKPIFYGDHDTTHIDLRNSRLSGNQYSANQSEGLLFLKNRDSTPKWIIGLGLRQYANPWNRLLNVTIWNNDGSAYNQYNLIDYYGQIYATKPSMTANSTLVATTSWIRDTSLDANGYSQNGLVHNSGAENINGIKTFVANPNVASISPAFSIVKTNLSRAYVGYTQTGGLRVDCNDGNLAWYGGLRSTPLGYSSSGAMIIVNNATGGQKSMTIWSRDDGTGYVETSAYDETPVGLSSVLTAGNGVTLKTSQDISGLKTISRAGDAIKFKNPNLYPPDQSSMGGRTYIGLMFVDKDGNYVADMDYSMETTADKGKFFTMTLSPSTGTSGIQRLGMCYNTNDGFWAIAPNRAYNASHTGDIVTIGMMSSTSTDANGYALNGLVHNSGNETIGGNKTFNSKIQVNNVSWDVGLQINAESAKLTDSVTGWTRVGQIQFYDATTPSRLGAAYIQCDMTLLDSVKTHELRIGVANQSNSTAVLTLREDVNGNGWAETPSAPPAKSAIRNITVSTTEPTSSDGNDGDVWILTE